MRLKLEAGEKLNRSPNSPILEVIGSGETAFLWIGNDAKNDKACFATVSGAKRLERLAKGILAALKESTP